MTVRLQIDARLTSQGDDGPRPALPTHSVRDPVPVRLGLFRRLSASRTFALGDRAGALGAAARRSGRAFRLDVRQRVIVKALVSRHQGRGGARLAGLAAHLAYLGRAGAGVDGDRAAFFDRDTDAVDARLLTSGWGADRHHFRFIVSPEHGDRIEDLTDYVRSLMTRVAADLGQPDLAWLATCHYDTDQPHAHVLVRGRGSDGRDLVIPRDYVSYGFRARAQEEAQARLGDLTRAEAERRVWRETEADRFTPLDRRLIEAADTNREVADGVGASGAWSALTRGRLRHLEHLGLATRFGRGYRLDRDLEARLRHLQRSRDVIRTLNQRRLESDAQITGLDQRVTGRVVRCGTHDELGAAPWVIVRDASGREHYAPLSVGHPPLALGATLSLVPGANGVARVEGLRSRGAGL